MLGSVGEQVHMNRLHNSTNPLQGTHKKVLCVCSAGLLRSPTAAWVLGQEPYGYNTRAVELTSEYALIKVDAILLSWADEIVVMEDWMIEEIKNRAHKVVLGFHNKKIINLGIEDAYRYREPELVNLIKKQYDSLAGKPESSMAACTEVIDE